MERSQSRQWGTLLSCFFIAFANAAPAFTNSTTSKPSSTSQLTTTSPPATTSLDTAATVGLVLLANFTLHALTGTIPAPCLPDAGQVCNRDGQPTYAYDASPYLNSYYTAGVHDWSPEYASQVTHCEGVFSTSLSEWLLTAPITYGSVVPETTIWDILGGGDEIVSSYTITATVVHTYTETLAIEPSSGLSATSFSVTTSISVDFAGVAATYIQTVAIVETTETETSFLGYLYPATTTTNSGWTYPVYTQAAYMPAGYASNFAFVPMTPCCKECTLFGGNVQVYFWPTATEASPVSTLINPAKFTFISPSIYVAFQSLYATDFCGTVGGDIYKATTLAFKESDLSTAPAYFWNSAEYNASQPFLPPIYTAATWEDQKSCTDITNSFYQWAASETGADYAYYFDVETYDVIPTTWPTDSSTFYHYTVTHNPCSPTLSVPTELFAINTLWSTCMQGIAGLFDPPYALSSGNGLVAFVATTAADSVTAGPVKTTSEAAAGPTVAPVTPSATKTAVSIDPTTSVSNDPPAQTVSSTAKDPSFSSSDPPAETSNNDPAQTQPSTAKDPPVSSSDPPAPSPSSPNTSAPPAQSLGIASLDPPPAVITIGSSTITANSASNFVIATQTLTPGGQITHSGTVLSLDPGASAIVIGGTITKALDHASSTSAGFLIGSQTLSPGGPAVTISGTTYSVQTDGSSVIIDGTTQPVSAFLSTPEYVIASQTLIPGGPAITVSGTVVSLQTGGSSVVVGGQTEALSVLLGPSTTEVSLGGIIATIGGFETPKTTTSISSYVQVPGSGYNGTLFVGGVERSRGERNVWALGFMLGIGVFAAWWL